MLDRLSEIHKIMEAANVSIDEEELEVNPDKNNDRELIDGFLKHSKYAQLKLSEME